MVLVSVENEILRRKGFSIQKNSQAIIESALSQPRSCTAETQYLHLNRDSASLNHEPAALTHIFVLPLYKLLLINS